MSSLTTFLLKLQSCLPLQTRTPHRNQTHCADDTALQLERLQSELQTKVQHLSPTPARDGIETRQGRVGLPALISAIESLGKEVGTSNSQNQEFSLVSAVNISRELFLAEGREKGLEIDLDFNQPFPSYVSGNLNGILQILILVLHNAVQSAMPGTLSITCFYRYKHLILNVSDTRYDDSGLSLGFPIHDKAAAGLKTSRPELVLAEAIAGSLGGVIALASEERPDWMVTLTVPFELIEIENLKKDVGNGLLDSLLEELEEDNKTTRILRKGISYLIDEAYALRIAWLGERNDHCTRIVQSMKGFPTTFGLQGLTNLILPIEEGLRSPEKNRHELLTAIDELLVLLTKIQIQVPHNARQKTSPHRFKRNRVQSINILVAEDNKISQEMLAYVLDELNYNYSMVENGLDVLNALKTKPFHLLLLDMQMPIMAGIETVKAIRANRQWKNLPIIAITARNPDGDKNSYRQAGCNDCVTKPINIGQLTRKIDQLLP